MEDWLNQHRYFNERPMLWGIPGALAGAFLALHLGRGSLLVLGLAALALGVFLLLGGRAVYALPLFLGLLLLRGAILPYVTVAPGEYEITGTVVDAPEHSRNMTVASLSRVTLNDQRVPGVLELTVPYDADLSYGEALTLTARVSADDRGAVRSLGTVLYSAEAAGPITVRPGRASRLYGLALLWREKLSASADALFGENAGIARGMLFGDRDDVHYLTFLVLILFCLLTGLSPASVRAACMLLLVRSAHLLDRQDDPLSEIGCAFALLLLIDPAFLLASGFRLSFGAIWGLCCLRKPVLELFHGSDRGIGRLLAGAVGVFLGMMPLLSISGGEVSLLGVLLSLLVLPAAPLFLIPGWLAVLLCPLLPWAAKALALLPQGVLYYLTTLAELVPADGLALPPCSGAALILWFAGMLFVSEYFLPNRARPAWLGWGLMMAGALVWFLF